MEFNLMEMIQIELAIIIAVTYVLGMFLKGAEMLNDRLIPFILLAFAIIFSILYKAIILSEGFTYQVILSGFLYGILVAGIAVFGNQLIKQARKE